MISPTVLHTLRQNTEVKCSDLKVERKGTSREQQKNEHHFDIKISTTLLKLLKIAESAPFAILYCTLTTHVSRVILALKQLLKCPLTN